MSKITHEHYLKCILYVKVIKIKILILKEHFFSFSLNLYLKQQGLEFQYPFDLDIRKSDRYR